MVALVAFLVFLPALQNDFLNWDDDAYVKKNFFIRSFDAQLFRSAFTKFPASNWHPLTWFSHALDYALWGLDPFGHHLTNIILHAVNSGIVVLLAMLLLEISLKRAGGARAFLAGSRGVLIAGAATGLLFGVHPVHVESVAWVAERKDLLCALFYLLSVLAYVRYASGREEDSRKPLGQVWTDKHCLLALGFFALALLSKPMAVSLPVVLLILDWYPLGRIRSLGSLGRTFLEKTPFVAFAAVSSILTVLAQRAGGAIASITIIPMGTRLIVAAESVIVYLVKMLLPVRLVPFYAYPPKVSLLSLAFGLPVLLVLSISAGCILAARSRRWLPAVWGYYLITLVPVLGIVQVGEQSMADRYTYLPSLGPFIVAGLIVARVDGWVATRSTGKTMFRAASVGSGLILLVSLSFLTLQQTGIWKNSIVFWKYVVEKEPSLYVAHDNLGDAYASAGQSDAAMVHYQEALRLNPYYALAHNNVGAEYLARKQYDAAIERFRTAISLKPDFALAHYNLGYSYFFKGQVGPAIEEYRTSLRLDPDAAVVHYDLGNAYYSSGQFDLAIEQYLQALWLNPDAATHYNLGNAYLSANRYSLAAEQFRSALLLDPDFVDAHFNLGLAYQKNGNPDMARAEFERVLAIKPGDHEARKLLGSLGGQIGKREEMR